MGDRRGSEGVRVGDPDVFDQTRRSRTSECRNCPEIQRTGQDRSVREKSVRANDPLKTNKIKEALSNLLVGTVQRLAAACLKKARLSAALDCKE